MFSTCRHDRTERSHLAIYGTSQDRVKSYFIAQAHKNATVCMPTVCDNWLYASNWSLGSKPEVVLFNGWSCWRQLSILGICVWLGEAPLRGFCSPYVILSSSCLFLFGFFKYLRAPQWKGCSALVGRYWHQTEQTVRWHGQFEMLLLRSNDDLSPQTDYTGM